MLELNEINTHYAGNTLTKLINEKYFNLAARIASESKRIICNSKQTRDRIIEHLDVNEEKTSVIRMGINPELESKEKKTYKDCDYTVGTLSYLDPRKRIDILIQSFKELETEDAELLIPSTGPDEKHLREEAEDDDRIKFLGYLPEEKKAEYFSSLDVFVLPSKFEGYGLTWVEAMACKTPVVSLKDSLVPKDVQKRTHVTTAEKLPKNLKEKDWKCDIEENLTFAEKHEWKRCAEKTIKVYTEIAKN